MGILQKLKRFPSCPCSFPLIFVVLTVFSPPEASSRVMSTSDKLKLFQQLYATANLLGLGGSNTDSSPTKLQTKVVFPFPEDVVTNRSYLPDLGFLADLAFLFLPNFPASGMIRLSRDVFESEQCVQYVACEMTKMSQKHRFLNWMQTFLQDFPFQGDVADRLRDGSMEYVRNVKRETPPTPENASKKNGKTEDLCVFSCSPIRSLSRGLKIMTLLNDLVRTVKF